MTAQPTAHNIHEWVEKVDMGGRKPGKTGAFVLASLAFIWSVFQLYYASPVPYWLSDWSGLNLTVNSTEARCVHLAFAFLIGFMAYSSFDEKRKATLWVWWGIVIATGIYALFLTYGQLTAPDGTLINMSIIGLSSVPLLMIYAVIKRSSQIIIPWYDMVIGIVGVFCALYPILFQDAILGRIGLPTSLDIMVFIVGMLILLEMTRRAIGFPLAFIAIAFLAYSILGPYLPDLVSHKGSSLSKLATHQWLTTEGVFGIALDVSTRYVFLFVLFGALLEKAGAGQYFIHVAFSLVGRFRGGPAKASVLASGLTGMISGSSIANVATTGTFTIPLMKKAGFKAERAGAIEVAAGVDGQIMPPVMGAAAFLMVEYVGIPYAEVIKNAFLPAILSYISLLYIVHLEAVKLGMQPLQMQAKGGSLQRRLMRGGIIIASLIIFLNVFLYIMDAIQKFLPTWSGLGLILIVALLYIISLVIAIRSKTPDQEDMTHLTALEKADFTKIFGQGLYYLIPIFILLWCLIHEALSATLSVFWAIIGLFFIMITHHVVLKGIAERKGRYKAYFLQGLDDIRQGMIAGGRGMVGIALATATAGVIVGTVSLTGVGFSLTELVAYISGGEVIFVLIFTAFLSLVLGMGLPTTPNYIIVSSLMAPIIVNLMGEAGLAVPLIAAHMFVFYFGIMADVTPPVGLASFAAAAIAKSPPMRTGLIATGYSLRTAVLPFIFIFNPELLLINLGGWWSTLLVIVTSTIASLVFVSATQGYFLTKNKWYESVVMLFVCFMLFRPDYFAQFIQPLYDRVEISQIDTINDYTSEEKRLRFVVDFDQDENVLRKTVMLHLGEPNADLKQRLQKVGVVFSPGKNDWTIQSVKFGSVAQKSGLGEGMRIQAAEIPNRHNPKEIFYVVGLVLLGGVAFLQHRRRQTIRVTRPA